MLCSINPNKRKASSIPLHEKRIFRRGSFLGSCSSFASAHLRIDNPPCSEAGSREHLKVWPGMPFADKPMKPCRAPEPGCHDLQTQTARGRRIRSLQISQQFVQHPLLLFEKEFSPRREMGFLSIFHESYPSARLCVTENLLQHLQTQFVKISVNYHCMGRPKTGKGHPGKFMYHKN